MNILEAPDLIQRYKDALKAYIDGGGEESLHAAYELGRQALGSDKGLLWLIGVHHTALLRLIEEDHRHRAQITESLSNAGRFLVESLSSYEMLHMDDQETTAALRRLNAILEEEAKRIAHVLHDEASQFLAVVYLEISEIERQAPAMAERVQMITSHLDQVREQLRRLSHELRPPMLDQLGLIPALRFLADGFAKRAGIEVIFSESFRERLPQLVETALYRVVQEALNNVARHAEATRVDITLAVAKGVVHCTVRDDGVGFDASGEALDSRHNGLGLIGMQERINTLHGRCIIDSAPGKGTEIRISTPLRSE